ncbi:DUF397 domain-containing protein [Embleya sp. AB8]|uniref:DUF397 domain-containing protein n=1 Tax=Embleya sp. AB8 TaxID=3156304 RepID=UPI003C743592
MVRPDDGASGGLTTGRANRGHDDRCSLAQEQLQQCQGGACVEVASAFHVVPVRDSKDPSIGHLALAPQAWASLVVAMRGPDRGRSLRGANCQ